MNLVTPTHTVRPSAAILSIVLSSSKHIRSMVLIVLFTAKNLLRPVVSMTILSTRMLMYEAPVDLRVPAALRAL